MRDYIKGYIDSQIGISDQWTEDDIEDVLALVLKRDIHAQWWELPIPYLDNKTPRQLWDSPDPLARGSLIRYVITYLSPVFT